MKKLIVIDVVGLTKLQLEKLKPKNISKILQDGNYSSGYPTFPAVTCSVQSSILTGTYPSEHGIIANGYYDKTFKQVHFWEQPCSLVERPQIWDILKTANPKMKTAVLFWQNTLFANSDVIVTPKPLHLEKNFVMWCYSKPENYYEKLVEELGEFDLKWYWGPFVSIESSKWIMNAAKLTVKNHQPDLLLVYVPHLDYSAQKFGPESNEFNQSINELDELIGDFLSFLESENFEYDIMLISEYGFNQVNNSVSPNVILNENNLLKTRNIDGKDYIDFEMSKAFAMCDHQIAHIYIKPGYENDVTSVFKKQPIGSILDKKSQSSLHIDNIRSGEIILTAEKNSWFNYYWWTDEKLAPDFSFSVDIHRKPGFDPLELFLDMKTKLISHDTSLIHGSHGIIDDELTNLPVFGATFVQGKLPEEIDLVQITPIILKYFGCDENFLKKSVI